MPDDIQAIASIQGFVTRPQVLDLGYDDRVIHELLRGGALERIGPGLYAIKSDYGALWAEERHALRCRAVATRFRGAVVFSHQSAAVLHGMAVWGVDLDDVHVTRLDDGRGRHQAGVAHHVAALSEDDVMQVNGLLVVRPARAVWDLAVSEAMEPALVTADSALNLKLTDDQELVDLAGRFTSWRGSRRAKATLSLSDARSESVGETRCRFAFRQCGLPQPDCQVEIFDDNGVLIGRSDFGWRKHRHLAEFDGHLKYRSVADDPEAASRIVTAEKMREDAIRAQGWGMTRIVWAELHGRARESMMARLRWDLERSQRLYLPAAS